MSGFLYPAGRCREPLRVRQLTSVFSEKLFALSLDARDQHRPLLVPGRQGDGQGAAAKLL